MGHFGTAQGKSQTNVGGADLPLVLMRQYFVQLIGLVFGIALARLPNHRSGKDPGAIEATLLPKHFCQPKNIGSSGDGAHPGHLGKLLAERAVLREAAAADVIDRRVAAKVRKEVARLQISTQPERASSHLQRLEQILPHDVAIGSTLRVGSPHYLAE